MDSSHIPLVIAIVILIVGSAYFSATETAFSSLNRIRMKDVYKRQGLHQTVCSLKRTTSCLTLGFL